MGLVKTRRLAAMQKQQRAKAGMKGVRPCKLQVKPCKRQPKPCKITGCGCKIPKHELGAYTLGVTL